MTQCSCDAKHPFNGCSCCCRNQAKEGDNRCQECYNGTHTVYPQQILDPTFRDRVKSGEIK